jgi:hypothetical protein
MAIPQIINTVLVWYALAHCRLPLGLPVSGRESVLLEIEGGLYLESWDFTNCFSAALPLPALTKPPAYVFPALFDLTACIVTGS